MIEQSKIEKIIELRVQGLSFEKISKRVKISKPTIISVIKKHRPEIAHRIQVELEATREKFVMMNRQRLELFGEMLKSFVAEVKTRDYSEIPTIELLKMILAYANQIKMEFDQSYEKKEERELSRLIGQLWNSYIAAHDGVDDLLSSSFPKGNKG